MITRHNMIRDIIYKYAGKAHLNPELERTGLLADPHVLVAWRRLQHFDVCGQHAGEDKRYAGNDPQLRGPLGQI